MDYKINITFFLKFTFNLIYKYVSQNTLFIRYFTILPYDKDKNNDAIKGI